MAPEAIDRSGGRGSVASPATDIFMFGGLLFEIMTAGLPPYYWMSGTWMGTWEWLPP